MIEQLRRQHDQLWALAVSTGHEADITDHVKRHIRIVRQKPDIGRLALSIANTEVAIADYEAALERGEHMMPKELQDTVETLERAVEAREEQRVTEQAEGGAQGEADGHQP